MTPLRALVLFASVLALGACTITITPDGSGATGWVRTEPAGIISEFAATREAYRIGERIEFRIRTNAPGYVTLTAQNPDGSVYVIARNVPVAGRRVEVIPSRSGRLGFVAGPPTGTHLVRAHFTPAATDERIVLTGTATLDGWMTRLLIELRGFGLGTEAVAESRFGIVR
jgi:hypothetical protein